MLTLQKHANIIFIMKKVTICLIVCLISAMSFSQDKPAYIIYDKNGEVVSYTDMLNSLAAGDVVFFGELHDNPIAHWLEFEVTSDLYTRKNGNITLGAEMFEADNQLLLDEYLTGLISQKRFEDEVKLWNNYKTDYKPLVEFAKEKGLKFVATNIPRRYASAVAMGGFEALDSFSSEAKSYMASLPIQFDAELPGYKAMLGMGGMPGGKGHASQNLPKAQAIKDATMAHFIHANLKSGNIFIHYNGSYHSNGWEGIVWYLLKSNPELKIHTISAVTQADMSKLQDENKGIADFIVVIPESMTRTY